MSFLEKSHSNSLTPTLPLVGQSLVTRSRPSASAWVITLTLTLTVLEWSSRFNLSLVIKTKEGTFL